MRIHIKKKPTAKQSKVNGIKIVNEVKSGAKKKKKKKLGKKAEKKRKKSKNNQMKQSSTSIFI